MITITENEFQKLSEYINKNIGIKLPAGKKALLQGRLQQVLIQNGFESFSEYYRYLVSDTTGNAMAVLMDRVTTNHTFFMREAAHFTFLEKTVLPYLESSITNKDIRIWSAGCSTGQEAYTIAMVVTEYFGSKKSFWDTTILATDISTRSIEKARQGVYLEEEIKNLPKTWVNKYFKKTGPDLYEVTDRLKRDVLFRKFNLTEKYFPFREKFDIIFCRNVMFYFDKGTRDKLVNRFYNCLNEGGYLFVGHSETLANTRTAFKYVIPAVYRKELKT